MTDENGASCARPFSRADRAQLDRAQRAYDAAVEAVMRSDRPHVELDLRDAEERLEAAEAALTAAPIIGR